MSYRSDPSESVNCCEMGCSSDTSIDRIEVLGADTTPIAQYAQCPGIGVGTGAITGSEVVPGRKWTATVTPDVRVSNVHTMIAVSGSRCDPVESGYVNWDRVLVTDPLVIV